MSSFDTPRIHVSIDQKVNLGNYESASVSFGVSQLPFDATDEEIEACLDKAKIVFEKMKARMRCKIADIRKEDGFGHADVEERMQEMLRAKVTA